MRGIDKTWSADLFDFKNYSLGKNAGFRSILASLDNLNKYVWSITLESKHGMAVTDEFSNIFVKSRRRPILLETDDGKEIVDKNFTDFLKSNDTKRYSRYTDKGAVFVGRFERTFRDFLRKTSFRKNEC